MALSRLYTLARNLPAEPKRFVKFLAVGSFGFAVDFSIFNLLHTFYQVPNTVADENIAQTISFLTAVLSNFLWNYFWIYPEAQSASQTKKISKFFIVSVTGFLIRTPIFNLALSLTERLALTLNLPPTLNPAGNLALMMAVGVVLLWNFFVNRYWTYRDVK